MGHQRTSRQLDFAVGGNYRSSDGTAAIIDLNDLRVFERVAELKSFSAASRALDLPKSSVSRSIQRLEAELGSALMRRTTRETTLTEVGAALQQRCAGLLGQLEDTVQFVSGLSGGPRGRLRISTGIGFAINVLAELLPRFALQYPKVDVTLELSSQQIDLVGDRIDVAIRMGPMPDSMIVARRLGVLSRYLCAAPAYLERRGTPATFDALREHDLIDFPVPNGRTPTWTFRRHGEVVQHSVSARFSVNCALTIHQMILKGGGIGQSSGYLCGPEIQAGRLVRLFSDWALPSVDVHAVFPNHREQIPAVRAFVDFMRENSWAGHHWQDDPIASQVEHSDALP